MYFSRFAIMTTTATTDGKNSAGRIAAAAAVWLLVAVFTNQGYGVSGQQQDPMQQSLTQPQPQTSTQPQPSQFPTTSLPPIPTSMQQLIPSQLQSALQQNPQPQKPPQQQMSQPPLTSQSQLQMSQPTLTSQSQPLMPQSALTSQSQQQIPQPNFPPQSQQQMSQPPLTSQSQLQMPQPTLTSQSQPLMPQPALTSQSQQLSLQPNFPLQSQQLSPQPNFPPQSQQLSLQPNFPLQSQQQMSQPPIPQQIQQQLPQQSLSPQQLQQQLPQQSLSPQQLQQQIPQQSASPQQSAPSQFSPSHYQRPIERPNLMEPMNMALKPPTATTVELSSQLGLQTGTTTQPMNSPQLAMPGNIPQGPTTNQPIQDSNNPQQMLPQKPKRPLPFNNVQQQTYSDQPIPNSYSFQSSSPSSFNSGCKNKRCRCAKNGLLCNCACRTGLPSENFSPPKMGNVLPFSSMTNMLNPMPYVQQSMGMANGAIGKVQEYSTGLKNGVGNAALDVGFKLLDGGQSLVHGLASAATAIPDTLFDLKRKGLVSLGELFNLTPRPNAGGSAGNANYPSPVNYNSGYGYPQPMMDGGYPAQMGGGYPVQMGGGFQGQMGGSYQAQMGPGYQQSQFPMYPQQQQQQQRS